MTAPYLDRHLIHNTSLACFLLTNFITEYEAEGSEHPIDLPKLLLVLPFVWNKNSREALAKRNSRSTLETVLRESPVLKIDLDLRIQAHTAATLQGLNLGVSVDLIERNVNDDHFKKRLTRWPTGTKSALPPDMIKTTKQLAIWFSSTSTATLYKLLFGIPNEIHH